MLCNYLLHNAAQPITNIMVSQMRVNRCWYVPSHINFCNFPPKCMHNKDEYVIKFTCFQRVFSCSKLHSDSATWSGLHRATTDDE